MYFVSPEWFLLVPAVLLAGWFWRRLHVFSPLRLILVILTAVTLADPRITKQDDSIDLWVLLDRSDSTEDLVDNGLPEWERLLEEHKPSRRDRIILVDYAAEVVEHGADGATFTGSRKLTRTALGLSHVAALADENRASRVLLFTDGFSTEPLNEAAERLSTLGIPLDYRLVRDETLDDFRVSSIRLPQRTQAGEPYLLEITVRGSIDGTIPLVIRRDNQMLLETQVELVNGVGTAKFTDRISTAGSFLYEAEVIPENDAHPGNNRSQRWIEITGGPKVLLVTHYENDPLAQVLSNLDFTVDIESNPTSLHPGRLSGTRAVIFNNVPAHEISQDFMDALDFFVREQAGGFLMIGGKYSFGSGGYFQSSIDPLLPVSMELKNEHRKLSVALAIVLDRSGSMAMNVAAGGKNVTKMDLANTGAAEAINLLGPMDMVTVFAVDSAPHTILPLTPIKQNKQRMMDHVRKIQSMGGGIYVYEGLKAAWDELQKANVGTRHVILFSDAADSEEPGDYRRLLATMKKEGVTVSVIGLGTNKDPDAQLLEDIAKRGDGRIFFSDRPMDIPKIFAQETVTIARSAFIDTPVAAQATGQWSEVSPKMLDWLPQVDGYNLSYLKEGDAAQSLVSTDEYVAPLVAHARRGLGRTAAISFPMGGEYSQTARTWPGYADFSQTIVRWLMGLDLPPGIGLRHRLEGTRLTMDLLYDSDEWNNTFAEDPPSIRLVESNVGAEPYEVPWRRIEPGHFSVGFDLEEGSIVRGAAKVGSYAIPFGPITVGSSIEWDFDPIRIDNLQAASAKTGGRELIDLADAWTKPTRTQELGIRLWLTLALLILVLTEALITRTGWRLPAFEKGIPKTQKAPKPKRTKDKKPAAVVTVPEQPKVKPVAAKPKPEQTESSARRSRYQRAKGRK